METLGFGDWLPDFTQTPLAKSIGLTAFKGPIQGALEGKLGIQQPGWRPGMPVDALKRDGAAIEPPPMPPFGEHPGTGALPGPAVQNNDFSVNYNNSPVGLDPAEHARQNERSQDRGLAKLPMFPGN